MTSPSRDGGSPISVTLGEVVPPQDPEDWTRPLTWVVALGMLAAPASAAAWYIAAAPTDAARALPGTFLVAGALAGGAAATGATQLGWTQAWTATLGAGLFSALLVVVVGVVAASERQIGTASPTTAHAFAAAVAGVAGAGAASLAAAGVAGIGSRMVRFAAALVAGVTVAVGLVVVLMP